MGEGREPDERGPWGDSRPHPYQGEDFAAARAVFARRGAELETLLRHEDEGPFGVVEALAWEDLEFLAEVAEALPTWAVRDYARSDVSHRAHREVIAPILLARPDCSLTMAMGIYLAMVESDPRPLSGEADPPAEPGSHLAVALAARDAINAGRHALDPEDAAAGWRLELFDRFRDGPIQREGRAGALDPTLLERVIGSLRAALRPMPRTVTVAGRVWNAEEYAELLYMVRTGRRPGLFAPRAFRRKYRWVRDHADAPRETS
jgi:hypothetical protein